MSIFCISNTLYRANYQHHFEACFIAVLRTWDHDTAAYYNPFSRVSFGASESEFCSVECGVAVMSGFGSRSAMSFGTYFHHDEVSGPSRYWEV